MFACSACARASAAAVRADPSVLAVLPSSPPVATHALWTPFVERLSRGTGHDFRLRVYDRMSEFEKDITQGTPDFLFSSPLQAMVAHKTQGYLPLVRGSRLVSAAIFVREDSPIRTVDDLAGKKIAYVGSKTL
jgi:phosphonate transport system substrate-binding protein